MERTLHERDRVGVQDLVLLEDFKSEDAFIDNLQKRFKENLIYVYIGQVLISINPYKNLSIYDEATVDYYKGRNFFEAPPHIFALTETAYGSLKKENRHQCILISGESGSGKTEASKKVLQFIAAATKNKKKVLSINDKLIGSNPVLEAFGNAKTNRNDNSSRFGKYMDIEFDFQGNPVGGNILNYLLEKSRVIHQSAGERNFHIFYQLLAGADDDTLRKLYLKRNLDTYYYLTNGTKESAVYTNIDDARQYKLVLEAMKTVELNQHEQDDLFGIVASVLHMGNVGFTEEEGKAKILKPASVDAIATLLGCDVQKLADAFIQRTINAHGDVVTSPLNRELAIYARDALAKAVYDRLFTWLVGRLNKSLQSETNKGRHGVIGILDIYGFEIFQKNSFEQFCINFCNEKLQQLFIQLTLKSEQEEYQREGITWEHIDYFNNQVICDLIEEKHKGIISLLDEECLRPGEPTDMSFLEKLNSHLDGHEHYVSHQKADSHTQKTMGRDEFRLVHYAGDVTYNVQGFMEKNNDLLFRDLREVMSNTKNSITHVIFDVKDLMSKKRPDTAVTQFKNSLNNLVDILMGKEPSYIRCIKPNDLKMSGQFDKEIVLHQVKYLGLMENLRVRRAGFAYRRPYNQFLERYKSLCPKTWPFYPGESEKDGVQVLVDHLKFEKNEYQMGNTKIFIRFPRTLFNTEDAFQQKKNDIATIIQSRWKGNQQRKRYLAYRNSVIVVQKYIRRYQAKKTAEKRKNAVVTIRQFIQGFITRNDPETVINSAFIELGKRHWLIRLSKSLPPNLLSSYWLDCPPSCTKASQLLRDIHKKYMANRYRKELSSADKKQFELKILAEKLFKEKKKSYQLSFKHKFLNDRLGNEFSQLKESFINNILPAGESFMYGISVKKFDRHGYKERERVLILTGKAVYIIDAKSSKLKHRIFYESILELAVTSESDNLLIIRIPTDLKKDKGDLILEVPHLIEAITKAIDITKNPKILNIVNKDSLSHKLVNGKEGTIDFINGNTPEISKNRENGHLLVVNKI